MTGGAVLVRYPNFHAARADVCPDIAKVRCPDCGEQLHFDASDIKPRSYETGVPMTDDYEPRDDVIDEPITAPIKPDFPDDDAIDPPSEDDASTSPEDPQ